MSEVNHLLDALYVGVSFESPGKNLWQIDET